MNRKDRHDSITPFFPGHYEGADIGIILEVYFENFMNDTLPYFCSDSLWNQNKKVQIRFIICCSRDF